MPSTCCRWLLLLLLLCRGANSGPVSPGQEGPFLLPGELGRLLSSFGYHHKLRAIQGGGGDGGGDDGGQESDYGEEEEDDEEEDDEEEVNEVEDRQLGLRAGGSWRSAQWKGRRTNAHLQGKRAGKGAKFALSLDVPTNILSILIDHAKASDTRSKAAHNAKLMARIGRRK
ncbi:uncharacterized protein LOC116952760 [Petromyzon marinus]|uniref:uncharacterized protein LOC116952760 n=1 Tax=Petromyzon marinus TaxID=7757 RepID=UPI003F70E8D8